MIRGVRALVLAVFLGHGSLPAGEVTVRASVDSAEYLVGDPITVRVDAAHPKGAAMALALGDTLDGFSVLRRAPFTAQSETTSVSFLTVARYDSGSAILPPLQVLSTAPGDSAPRVAATQPITLIVRTVLLDTSGNFRDIKPPLTIPITLAEIALVVGILAALGGFGYLAYRLWRKRQKKAEGDVYVPPPRPAHVIAFEELRALKEKHLWQQGRFKEYYSGVSEIIRRYVENRYRIMALEQTTGEIIDALTRIRIKPSAGGQVESLLRLADLVKFAKYVPGIPEHEQSMSMAFDIVEATKLVESPAGVQMHRRAEVHVES